MASVVFANSAQTDLLEAWLFIAEELGITVLRVLHHARDIQRIEFYCHD
jgi:hypothetical protein